MVCPTTTTTTTTTPTVIEIEEPEPLTVIRERVIPEVILQEVRVPYVVTQGDLVAAGIAPSNAPVSPGFGAADKARRPVFNPQAQIGR